MSQKKQAKKRKPFIDNKRLYTDLVRYRSVCEDADRDGKDRPRIPDAIGADLQKIVHRLGLMPNFAKYPFWEEMIDDGLENCIYAVDKFDPDRSTYPFSFFSQVAYNAFIRRINKEKKQLYIKHKLLEQFVVSNMHDVGLDQGAVEALDNPYMNELVRKFEATEAAKRDKSGGGGESDRTNRISYYDRRWKRKQQKDTA